MPVEMVGSFLGPGRLRIALTQGARGIVDVYCTVCGDAGWDSLLALTVGCRGDREGCCGHGEGFPRLKGHQQRPWGRKELGTLEKLKEGY